MRNPNHVGVRVGEQATFPADKATSPMSLLKDCNILASLAEEAEIDLPEFCREVAEVRAATEREKARHRFMGERRKSRSWMKSNLGQA